MRVKTPGTTKTQCVQTTHTARPNPSWGRKGSATPLDPKTLREGD